MKKCTEGIGGEGLANALLKDAKALEVPASAVLMVMLTVFLDTLSSSISGPVIPYYAKSFNAQLQSIGWLYAAANISSFIFAPLLSRTADSWGRRPVLLMSLFGAGAAGIVQGLANQPVFGSLGFYVFLFGRFFAGIWSATAGTCQIYIADVCPEEVRNSYLAKVSAMPILGTLFGPGLGGGMAALGLSVPMLVDGCITLFTAGLVAYHLPETPAFMKTKMLHNSVGSGAVQATASPVAWKVYLLCISDFFGSVSIMTTVALFAIFMDDRFHPFSALKIGFCSMYQAVIMLLTNIFAVQYLQNRMSTAATSLLGVMIVMICIAIFPFNYNLPLALSLMGGYAFGAALHGASMPSLLADFSNDDNRGKVFGMLQFSNNMGAIVGPIVATNLAQRVSIEAPWIFSSLLGTLSAIILFFCRKVPARVGTASAESIPPIAHDEQGRGEIGTEQDVSKLGHFMAELLRRKGYKWISKREEVERLLDLFVPQFPEEQSTSYDQVLEEMLESDNKLGRTAVRAFNP